MDIRNTTTDKEDYNVWIPTDRILDILVEQEDIQKEEILAGIRSGTLSVLSSQKSSQNRKFKPCIIGSGTRKKVCAAIGMDANSVAHFMESELKVILNSEPNVICDVSIGDGISDALEWIRKYINIPLGSCPTYDILNAQVKSELSKEDVLEKIEAHMKAGVDFILLHMGLSYDMLESVNQSNRVMRSTSRGGGAIIRYMKTTGKENPFILYLDEIVELCKKYQVVLDIGDIFRTGCLEDGDSLMQDGCLKAIEVEHLNELRKRALDLGAQVVCEAGGHIALNKIEEFVKWLKHSFEQAPIWFNGPLPTDRAVGYDSIANAIGTVHAAVHGGDMFLALTDSEHYSKPSPMQSAEAIRAIKIALSVAEYSTHVDVEVEKNHKMGKARQDRKWNDQVDASLFPKIARNLFNENGLLYDAQPCSLCGPLCPLLVNK